MLQSARLFCFCHQHLRLKRSKSSLRSLLHLLVHTTTQSPQTHSSNMRFHHIKWFCTRVCFNLCSNIGTYVAIIFCAPKRTTPSWKLRHFSKRLFLLHLGSVFSISFLYRCLSSLSLVLPNLRLYSICTIRLCSHYALSVLLVCFWVALCLYSPHTNCTAIVDDNSLLVFAHTFAP